MVLAYIIWTFPQSCDGMSCRLVAVMNAFTGQCTSMSQSMAPQDYVIEEQFTKLLVTSGPLRRCWILHEVSYLVSVSNKTNK